MSSLPTFDRLGASPPKHLDAGAVGKTWTSSFAQHISSCDIPNILGLLHADIWWRDIFALTWDLRTFEGTTKVETFLRDRLQETEFSGVKFVSAEFQQVFPDLAWTLIQFSFETHVGLGRGVARLVYNKDSVWKATTVCTVLDGLKGHAELGRAARDFSTCHPAWDAQRAQEREFADRDPEVLIVGAGHSGLEVAARLKHLGVSALVLDKNERIGDNWRKRYESLTLHDPIWMNHLPYFPFPESWPVFAPAGKFSNWLQLYADALELNCWTSANVTHAKRDDATGKWVVTVQRADGSERVLRVDHVVLAHGYPFKHTTFHGQENFQGQIVYSSTYRNAKDWAGKKVVVIGACTSGHDISAECADLGIDVTMYQRSSTYVISMDKVVLPLMPAAHWEGLPLEDVDRISQSMPYSFQKTMMIDRGDAELRTLDKDLHDSLEKVGYKVNREKVGGIIMFLARGGGHYLDVGACQRIIDGKIMIKNGSEVARFTKDGVAFEDGSELKADVIVVATGFDDIRIPAQKILGPEVGSMIPPIWGLNNETEPYNVWRDLAPVAPNMWPMLGNLSFGRFFSKQLALQILAKQRGVFGERYSAEAEHSKI